MFVLDNFCLLRKVDYGKSDSLAESIPQLEDDISPFYCEDIVGMIVRKLISDLTDLRCYLASVLKIGSQPSVIICQTCSLAKENGRKEKMQGLWRTGEKKSLSKDT